MRAFVSGGGAGGGRDGTHNVPIIRRVKNSFLCSRLVKGLDDFLERDRDRELFLTWPQLKKALKPPMTASGTSKLRPRSEG